MESEKNIVVTVPTKSVGVSVVLTLLFGSLGLLYSTTIGGIFMIFVELAAGAFTFGIGLIFTRPICIILGIIAVNRYNRRMIKQYTQ